MTGTTPNYAFPYPEGSDKVATHADIRALATAIDVRGREVDESIRETLEQFDALAANSIQRKTDPGTTHLDEIQTPGFYPKASTGSATPANGYPVQSRGNLWVLPIAS